MERRKKKVGIMRKRGAQDGEEELKGSDKKEKERSKRLREGMRGGMRRKGK